MRNSGLWGRPFVSPEQVVGALGAVQAQEFSYAKWSVGQRTRSAREADLDRAVDAGTILRTHVLRPTWHFVLPADIRWLLALTGPRVHARSAPYHRRLGLDGDLLRRGASAIAKSLEGGRHLTRAEVAAGLERAGIPAQRERLAFIVMHAELEGIVCSGASRGKQRTLALLDERAPAAVVRPRDEALAELTRRYFTAHGPATVTDYVWWSGLLAADARRGIEILGPELRSEIVDDRTYLMAAATPTRRTRASGRVDLLQVYDEVVVSYTRSRDVLTMGAIVPDEAGFLHPVLLDGRWIGRWRVERERSGVVVRLSLARRLDADEQAALEAQVGRYGRFLGVPAGMASRPRPPRARTG